MKDTSYVRSKHKARKNLSHSFPSAPPEIDSSVEVLFRSLNKSSLENVARRYGDKMVTSQVLYKPALLAVARVTFHSPRWNLHQERDILKVIPLPAMAGVADWENSLVAKWDNHNVRSSSEDGCMFMIDGAADFSKELFENLQEEFIHFLITNHSLQFDYNPYAKLCRRIEEPKESFLSRCTDALRDLFGLEMRAQGESLQMQKERLKEKLDRKFREQSEEASQDLNAYYEKQFAELRNELSRLEKAKEDGAKQFEEKLAELSAQQETDFLRLNRGNIQILRFALVWLPYTEFVIQEDDRRRLEVVECF